jgi:hypothetical protein
MLLVFSHFNVELGFDLMCSKGLWRRARWRRISLLWWVGVVCCGVKVVVYWVRGSGVMVAVKVVVTGG